MPQLDSHSKILAEMLRQSPDIYYDLRQRRTKMGVGLARCIKAGMDSPHCKDVEGDFSLYAGDEESYETFSELFDQVISRLAKLDPGQRPYLSGPSSLSRELGSKRMDPSGRYVVSCQVRVARNFKGFRFPPAMDLNERVQVEKHVSTALRGMSPAIRGVYLPLTGSRSYFPQPGGMDPFEERALKVAGLFFGPSESESEISSGLCKNWPHSRGVFMSTDRATAVWVNHEDHVSVSNVQGGDDLQLVYRELQRVMGIFTDALRRSMPVSDQQAVAFAQSARLGYLTSAPMHTGAALKASVVIQLPELGKMEASEDTEGPWVEWASSQHVKVEKKKDHRGKTVPSVYELWSTDRFDTSDADILNTVIEVASKLVEAELLLLESGESGVRRVGIFETAKLEVAQPQAMLASAAPQLPDAGEVTSGLAHSVNSEVAQDFVDTLITSNIGVAQEQALIEEERRTRARPASCEKLVDGSLEEASLMAKLCGSDVAVGSDFEVEHISEVVRDMADFREDAYNKLLQAAGNGSLHSLVAAFQASAKSARQNAGELLLQAADNGQPQEAFKEVKAETKQASAKSARQNAGELLLQAADNGELEQ
ncbi:unnamed protein product, partial [Polarella glacialis]